MQVIVLVKQAQYRRSRTQYLAIRAAFVLTVVSLAVRSLSLSPWLIYVNEFAFAIERAVTVMVTACPHALGLAIPLVVAVSTSLAAKSGLLVRDRQAFESARDIKAVVFDKTGTLTENEMLFKKFSIMGRIFSDQDGEIHEDGSDIPEDHVKEFKHDFYVSRPVFIGFISYII